MLESVSATAAVVQGASGSVMADHRTPLVRRCWYVAGRGDEFTRQLRERSLLGESVVLYRTEAGRPVVLQNRCPHRSFPLAKGSLEADAVRCGYHGLAFDSGGKCVDIPSQEVIPQRLAIRSYPAVERGPFVWVWMGDPADADPGLVPATPWLASQDWTYASNYVFLGANYVGLHENLLDLTHFTYLHPTTLGTPEYARAPFQVEAGSETVRISRLVPECDVPAIYRTTGMRGKMSRHTVSEFLTPALHHASAVLRDLEADGVYTVYISHFVTPADQDRTHYWFTFARDFQIADQAITEFTERSALHAFNEDVDALQEIARMHGSGPDAKREISLKSDQAGVAARRILRSLADREAGPA